MSILAFTALGYVLFVAAVFYWNRSDDTAFNKACSQIKEMNSDWRMILDGAIKNIEKSNQEHLDKVATDVAEWVAALSQMKSVVEVGFDKTTGAIEKLEHKTQAQELELHQLRDTISKMQKQLTPKEYRYTLSTDGKPLQVEIVRKQVAKEKNKGPAPAHPGPGN